MSDRRAYSASRGASRLSQFPVGEIAATGLRALTAPSGSTGSSLARAIAFPERKERVAWIEWGRGWPDPLRFGSGEPLGYPYSCRIRDHAGEVHGKRSTGGANHGKRSSKFNQDCTICRSCRRAMSGPTVLKQQENRVNTREFRRTHTT